MSEADKIAIVALEIENKKLKEEIERLKKPKETRITVSIDDAEKPKQAKKGKK